MSDDEQLVAIDVVVDKDDEQEETSSDKAPLAIEIWIKAAGRLCTKSALISLYKL